MWTAKFRVYDENGVYSKRARKFGINLYGYPLNYYSDKKYFYFTAIGFIGGDEKAKTEFLEDLKQDKRIDELEANNSFFVAVTKETITNESKRYVRLFYNPLIIHLKPTIIYPDGWEENEIASFKRKFIEEIIQISKKQYSLKLSYFKQQKISNIGILNILPELTDKQKNAITLAAKHGYYDYPRKIDVQDLAKMEKLSFSTFQEHLRRAENKLLPFILKKF